MTPPQEHHYPAAAGYFALLAAPSQVAALLSALRGGTDYVGRMHWLGFNTRRIASVRAGLQ